VQLHFRAFSRLQLHALLFAAAIGSRELILARSQ
jgi:hypothetical protein